MAAERSLGGVFAVAFVLSALTAAGPEPEPEEAPNVADLAALIEAHNRERAAKDLPPLTLNPKLEAAALAHSRDMAKREKMTHEGGDGSTPAKRIERQDYHFRAAAENVAAGQRNVAEAMKSWIDSPPHKKNILGDFTEMGAAAVKAEDGTPYWTVNFGLPWPKLDPDEAATGVLEALNRARAEAKKPPFKAHAKLADAAQRHARDMAANDKYRPEDADGQTPFQRIQKSGYRFRRLVEATASGQPTPEETVKSLLEDSTNRDAILGDFRDVGVGYATAKKGTPYWSLIFAKPAR